MGGADGFCGADSRQPKVLPSAAGPSASSTRKEASEATSASAVVVKAAALPHFRASKPRIDCIDGCRFVLVFPIVVGHFAKFGLSSHFALRLLTQENVLVGGFFIISGYVMGYVSTNMGERSHNKKKLEFPELFFWQKVMSYYPLHLLVSTAFSPMFVIMDRMQHTWSTTSLHAFLNYTLLQAWFPASAEIWNPPVWFLSALTFGNLTMPTVLPYVASLSRDGLRKLLGWLTASSILGKVSYSAAWRFWCKGPYRQRHTLPKLWNVTRFHPFWALHEITMGIAAARLVMLEPSSERQRSPAGNPAFYFFSAFAALILRNTSLNLNDAMIRSVCFIPMFMKFLTSMHRDSMSEQPKAITRVFGSKLMTRLGSLAFPMFILHGPLGQLFYKKKIATYLWGRVMPKHFFPAYLLLVMTLSHITNEFFVKSKAVQRWSEGVAQFMAKRTSGMLRDDGDVEPAQEREQK